MVTFPPTMTHAFTPYPGYPEDPARLEEVRQRIAALPRGLDFYDALEQDPEMVAVYKTDIVRLALAQNAAKPERERRREATVIEHEEWIIARCASVRWRRARLAGTLLR